MRPHEAVARILLLLSIFNFTFAGVAQTPTIDETRVDLVAGAEDMTEASERGHTQLEELPEWLVGPSTTGPLHSRVDPVNPEANKFFSKELTRRMKEYFVLGAVASVFVGLSNAVQKEILGTVSPGASTIGRSVEPLNERSQDQEDLVSRSLSNMRDEHLQMLSAISRRTLNGLDKQAASERDADTR